MPTKRETAAERAARMNRLLDALRLNFADLTELAKLTRDRAQTTATDSRRTVAAARRLSAKLKR